MYIVKQLLIQHIPVIEYIPEALKDKSAPLVIFYHGWTNHKQQVAPLAHELMAHGFRVLAPDCHLHGERLTPDASRDKADFFNVILKNVEELPLLINYYQNKGLIADDFVAVSGLSMGGITTCMLATQYPKLNAFGVLMGTPKLQAFTKHILQTYEKMAGQVDTETEEQMRLLHHQMAHYDLFKHPEKLKHRPMHFWHAQDDPVVPYRLTAEFVQEVQNKQLNPYLHLVTNATGGHKVPDMAFSRLAYFFNACYVNTIKRDTPRAIWPQTERAMRERFGTKQLASANFTTDQPAI